MTLRNSLLSCLVCLPWTAALAHDGDHSGMTETFIQLHHMGWPLAVIAIAIAAAVVMVRKAARRDTTHGADGH